MSTFTSLHIIPRVTPCILRSSTEMSGLPPSRRISWHSKPSTLCPLHLPLIPTREPLAQASLVFSLESTYILFPVPMVLLFPVPYSSNAFPSDVLLSPTLLAQSPRPISSHGFPTLVHDCVTLVLVL